MIIGKVLDCFPPLENLHLFIETMVERVLFYPPFNSLPTLFSFGLDSFCN